MKSIYSGSSVQIEVTTKAEIMARSIVLYLIVASFLILVKLFFIFKFFFPQYKIKIFLNASYNLFFYFQEIRAAVDLAQPIATRKNRVKTASSDLERYNRNMIFNVKNKLDNLKINEMSNVNTSNNNALDATRVSFFKIFIVNKNFLFTE